MQEEFHSILYYANTEPKIGSTPEVRSIHMNRPPSIRFRGLGWKSSSDPALQPRFRCLVGAQRHYLGRFDTH